VAFVRITKLAGKTLFKSGVAESRICVVGTNRVGGAGLSKPSSR